MTNHITELAAQMRGLAEAAATLDHNENASWYDSGSLLGHGLHYPKNTRFIEAASPANIIALLDALKAAQAEVARLDTLARGQHVELYNARLRLAELAQQEPVALVTHRIIPAGHGELEETTFDVKWLALDPFKWQGNLYAAAGASPAQPLPVNDDELPGMWSHSDTEGGETDVYPAQPAKDHEIAALVNRLTEIAKQFHGAQQLRERISHEVVPVLRATQPAQMPGWLPIESAPKDGTHVLICDSDGNRDYCYYTPETETVSQFVRKAKDGDVYKTVTRECGYWASSTVIDPTHWMPLPAVPSAEHTSQKDGA